jgi:hypothetical protein
VIWGSRGSGCGINGEVWVIQKGRNIFTLLVVMQTVSLQLLDVYQLFGLSKCINNELTIATCAVVGLLLTSL